MRAFGFVSPVVIEGEGEIIAGHGCVAAAKLLGHETVPVVREPFDRTSEGGAAYRR